MATAPPSSPGALPLPSRLLLGVAALCHLSWLLALVSPSVLPTRTSYVSELMAVDQPWSPLMRALDVVAGAATVVAVVIAWAGLRAATRGTGRAAVLVLVGLLGLATFGAFTVVDSGLLPMSCAPSADAACAAAEAAGTVPTTHQLHSVSSTIASTGAVVGLVAAAATLWLLRTPPTARHAWLTGAVVAAYVVVTGWVLVETAGATPGLPTTGRVGVDALGWSHRLDITLSSTSLLLLAAAPPLRARPSGSR